MTDEIIRHCAPTLAGMKTGSMVSCKANEVDAWLAQSTPALNVAGLRIALLRRCERRALLYIYRPNLLASDFSDEGVARHLLGLGYNISNLDDCVSHLASRFQGSCECPHEVGLFLGYPLEDVLGFIEHGGAQYKCNGHWKVYGDEVCAKRLFRQFRECTRSWLMSYQCGASLEQLIAADMKIT